MRCVSEFMRFCAGLGLAAIPLAAPVSAQIRIDASAGWVTDYRYRGISLSDGRPAFQGGLEVSAGEWFAGTWGSTTHDHDGSGMELDLYGGRRGAIHDLNYALTGYLYLDPSRSDVNYAEVQALLDRKIGNVDAEIEVSLAPEQTHLYRTGLYLAAGLSVPLVIPGTSLSAHAGYEDGDWRHKTDWDVGADYRRGSLRLGAHLIGTRGPDCRQTVGRAAGTALVGSARFELRAGS